MKIARRRRPTSPTVPMYGRGGVEQRRERGGRGPVERDVLHNARRPSARGCDRQRLAGPGHGLDERHVPADDPRGAEARAAVRRRIGQDRRLRAVTVHNDVDTGCRSARTNGRLSVSVLAAIGSVVATSHAVAPRGSRQKCGRRTGLGAVPGQIGGSRGVDRDAGLAPRADRGLARRCAGAAISTAIASDGERTVVRKGRPSQRRAAPGNPSYIRTCDSSPERMSSTTAAMSRSMRRSASRNATRARIIACASRAFGLACSIPRRSRACASAIR